MTRFFSRNFRILESTGLNLSLRMKNTAVALALQGEISKVLSMECSEGLGGKLRGTPVISEFLSPRVGEQYGPVSCMS